MKMAKEFHDKSKREGEYVIDVWTQTSCFDITFENENPNDNLPSITITNRQWNHVIFEPDRKKNMNSLNHYFLKELSRKMGHQYIFNPPSDGGNIVDNFEIILENGKRLSYLADYNKQFNLKDLKITRWSKLMYRHTKQSTENIIELNKSNNIQLYNFNYNFELQDPEGDDLIDLKKKTFDDIQLDNS